ncbi:MAG: hypothetical protein RL660_1889 [Bacteroidota bacterium]|jgi:hypothetical protein
MPLHEKYMLHQLHLLSLRISILLALLTILLVNCKNSRNLFVENSLWYSNKILHKVDIGDTLFLYSQEGQLYAELPSLSVPYQHLLRPNYYYYCYQEINARSGYVLWKCDIDSQAKLKFKFRQRHKQIEIQYHSDYYVYRICSLHKLVDASDIKDGPGGYQLVLVRQPSTN